MRALSTPTADTDLPPETLPAQHGAGRADALSRGESRAPSPPPSLPLYREGGGASIDPNIKSLDFQTFAVIFMYLNGGLSSPTVM